jgi:hypothetical protein
MSTPRTLRELIDKDLHGAKFIAVSNREPYVHSRSQGVKTIQMRIRFERPRLGVPATFLTVAPRALTS